LPAYTNLRAFVNALKSGKSHICQCLDHYFGDLAAVRNDPNYPEFSDGSWSGGPPDWLEGFLRSIGLTAAEASHVVRWPAPELENTRQAAAAAVASGRSPTFFWTLYDGDRPQAVSRAGPRGEPQVLFQSPAASLRLTSINYGEVYVEEV